MKYLNNDFTQNLYSKQLEIDKKLKIYIRFAEKELQKEIFVTKKDSEKFLTFKKIIRLQILRDKMALDRGLDFGIDPLFEKIMIDAKDFVNRWDGKLYFVYLPAYPGIYNSTTDRQRLQSYKKVINLVEELNIPIIASGGAGSIQHFVDAFNIGKSDAALAASVFHFEEIAIQDLKKELKKNNIEVRL